MQRAIVTKEAMAKSEDARVYRRQTWITFASMGAILAVAALIVVNCHSILEAVSEDDSYALFAICLLPLIALLPTALFSLFRWRIPIHQAKNYDYYEVQFQKPDQDAVGRHGCFSFEFCDFNGKGIQATTHHIFSYVWNDTLGSQIKYANAKVAIAYNPKTEDVIVLRPVESEEGPDEYGV